MPNSLVAPCPPGEASVASKTRSVVPSRSVAASRSRRRSEAQKGNQNALKHGAYALVHAQVDTATEVALTFITHPNLTIADLRLVETYAIASWQFRKAAAEIEASGYSQTLTAWCSRLAALVERLEQRLRDRDRERQAELRRGKVLDLSRYAPVRQEPQP